MLDWLQMVHRRFWTEKIERAWERRSVVWMSGVRRVGKTYLCLDLPEIEYFDCELPATRRRLEDPHAFLDSARGKRVVLDEIHRLENPSELLKIAADHYPDTRVLATGSSTLGASTKFRDTLTGRKTEIWLTPMASQYLEDFGQPDISHRLVRGGLPPFFLAPEFPEREFQEWIDGYWAKDIQEMFRLERRQSFQKCAELLMTQSGGIFEASRFTDTCEISRPTVRNYLAVMEETFLMHVVRPFSSHTASEITSAPKVYAFDTGFVCYHRGWRDLRQEDLGALWEHYVLNELHARLQTRRISYWRDKRGHEVDFVLVPHGGAPIAIECKWSADGFNPANLRSFRRRYPGGENFVVAYDVTRAFRRTYGELNVEFVSLSELADAVVRRER
ncbi:MAG: ATP-binding protein [Armatimonadetes bacterium]|nr:ATP-binding protein [Armatimonadota bacterium]